MNDAYRNQDPPKEVKTYLGGMAAAGEITLFIAAAGVGKTLSTLGLLAADIKADKIDPRHIAYINKDDSGHGLSEKTVFANDLGFHVIADANGQTFDKVDLVKLTRKLIRAGRAKKSLIIIDTVKKFHDVNDKNDTVKFHKLLRPFTMAGGTVVGLAHTNKSKDQNGASVYAGVADNIQDVDAAYVGDVVISPSPENSRQVVEFKQIKGRLVHAGSVFCGFASGGGMTWHQRVKTLHTLSPNDLSEILVKQDRKCDEEIIHSISESLRFEGSMSKMKLVKTVTDATVKSRRDVLTVLDRYSGTDPRLHLWNFKSGHHGAKNYRLLDSTV